MKTIKCKNEAEAREKWLRAIEAVPYNVYFSAYTVLGGRELKIAGLAISTEGCFLQLIEWDDNDD